MVNARSATQHIERIERRFGIRSGPSYHLANTSAGSIGAWLAGFVAMCESSQCLICTADAERWSLPSTPPQMQYGIPTERRREFDIRVAADNSVHTLSSRPCAWVEPFHAILSGQHHHGERSTLGLIDEVFPAGIC